MGKGSQAEQQTSPAATPECEGMIAAGEGPSRARGRQMSGTQLRTSPIVDELVNEVVAEFVNEMAVEQHGPVPSMGAQDTSEIEDFDNADLEFWRSEPSPSPSLLPLGLS